MLPHDQSVVIVRESAPDPTRETHSRGREGIRGGSWSGLKAYAKEHDGLCLTEQAARRLCYDWFDFKEGYGPCNSDSYMIEIYDGFGQAEGVFEKVRDGSGEVIYVRVNDADSDRAAQAKRAHDLATRIGAQYVILNGDDVIIPNLTDDSESLFDTRQFKLDELEQAIAKVRQVAGYKSYDRRAVSIEQIDALLS